MVTNTIVINLGTRRAPMVNKDMGSMVRGAMDKDITSWAGTYVLLRWSAGWREVRHLAWMMPEPRLVDDVACQMVVEWTIHFLRGWCKISSANLVLLLVFFFFSFCSFPLFLSFMAKIFPYHFFRCFRRPVPLTEYEEVLW